MSVIKIHVANPLIPTYHLARQNYLKPASPCPGSGRKTQAKNVDNTESSDRGKA